ncbi:MAG: hypothetical protein HND39_14420 [Ignavibacteriota bacterium]|jgi:hypothetical protein|nr:hypothetical protein [Ignavibacteriota bacterium]MCC7094562.1 hypothetical protein [Ignavibacteriaceae bacterium]MEB2296530.1 hypothetical protein [Ignavibacteria bacterium]QKJ97383.1 MAG: hypothetical protein HND39_14420 [Ignavibacteriota bacterium]GIK60865.1 MAG: hypothetical protein BroJett017_17550 [Ignavibacteriota bacterium]
MELVKVYLIQSITTAANNLRLNAQQIEVVGLLRETIINAEDIGAELLLMKKTTELSKLAIRLSEIHTFLTQGKVDFIKISEQFREHSRYLIRDLNQFLENVTPNIFKDAFLKMNNTQQSALDIELVDRSNLSQELFDKGLSITDEKSSEVQPKITYTTLDFEKKILSPIKSLDDILKKIPSGNVSDQELKHTSELMTEHAELSSQQGFKVLSQMHNLIARSFDAISKGNLIVDKTIVESLRACLIVIVAVVKRKDVDITGYLNRAEEFGNKYFQQNF